MADSRVQLEVENWIRKEWMQGRFGQEFVKDKVELSAGGSFQFDAVSEDRSIIATISTSNARTRTGKMGAGKKQKIRADMFFLLLAKDVQRRLVILTESDMHEEMVKEKDKRGRVPASIELFHANLPSHLVQLLDTAKAVASKEVSPL